MTVREQVQKTYSYLVQQGYTHSGGAEAFAEMWAEEECRGDFHIGVPDHDTRPALIATTLAAKAITSINYKLAINLLRFATRQVERAIVVRETR